VYSFTTNVVLKGARFLPNTCVCSSAVSTRAARNDLVVQGSRVHGVLLFGVIDLSAVCYQLAATVSCSQKPLHHTNGRRAIDV
jgi:hypothetical protein